MPHPMQRRVKESLQGLEFRGSLNSVSAWSAVAESSVRFIPLIPVVPTVEVTQLSARDILGKKPSEKEELDARLRVFSLGVTASGPVLVRSRFHPKSKRRDIFSTARAAMLGA